jgi:hypothetical protein
MDGGGQLTDPVVGRDRPRIATVTQGHAIAQAASCLQAIGSAHALFAYPPNGGRLPFTTEATAHEIQNNSDLAHGRTGHAGGRLMVR